MITNNIRGLILFLLILHTGFSFAQIKVISGTSVIISSATILNISGSNADTFEIASGATVTNDGIIILGDSTIIKEFPGYPVKGLGYEEATRNYTQSLNNENIAGLGASLTTTDSLGVTIIKRGHTSYIDNLGNESVLRWFDINPSYNRPDNALMFNYDSTELNGLNASNLYLFQSSDSGITWHNLGRANDSTQFSVYAQNIDTLSLFILFPIELITGTVSSDTLCAGQSITVPYTINGQVNSGNYFRTELSDSTGSFANPHLLDSVKSVNSGSITASIPANLPAGFGYRIRVVSTDPYIIGSDNGVPLFGDSLPEPAEKPVGDSSICLSTTNVSGYTVNTIGKAVDYNWQILPATAGNINSSANSVTVTWNTSYKGIASLIVSGSNTCGTGAADTLLIDLKDVPSSINIPVGDTAICTIAATVSNYSISAVPDADDYIWDLNPYNAGAITGTGNNISITWDSLFSGSAVLSVAGNNSCGTGVSDSLVILISKAPAGSNIPVGDTIVCKTSTTVSNYSVDTIPNALTYQWTLNPANAGELSVSENNVSVNWDSLFFGAATLSVAGINGCGKGPETSISIEVKDSQVGILSLNGDNQICLNSSANNAYSTDSLSSISSYLWTLSPVSAGMLTSSDHNAIITWNSSFTGYAELIVTVVNTCGTSSSKSLSINVTNIAAAPGKPTGDTLVCTDSILQSLYSTSQVLNATSYKWTLSHSSAGSIEGNGENITISWDTSFNGKTSIKVIALNECGESIASDSLSVKVNNCDDIKENEVEVTIILFPNPAKNNLNIKVEGINGEIDITMIDLLGQVILNENINDVKGTFTQTYSVKQFAKGVYFLRFKTKDGLFIEKFIIQ